MLAMPWAADAAGLGKITVTSALGQPLRAEIDLISVPKDDVDLLVAKPGAPEDYKRAGLDRPEGLQTVRFAVEKRPDGQPYLKVSSAQPMNEPFLQLLVQLDWPAGRILRNYTVLLDPPGLQERPAAPAVSAPTVKAVPEAAKAEPAVVPEKAAPVAAKPAPAKKSEVLVHAQPAQPLTPAEQTFPRFAGERELPPPAPAPAAKAVVAAPVEKTYKVKSGDTLAKIAQEFKPEGYSLDQMLVSLFEANKQAFDGANMNRLKSGQILRVPEKSQLDAVSRTEAAKEVKTHAADWNAYRQKLAATAAEEKPAEKAGAQEAAGKITAKVEDRAPKAQEPAQDVLKLSKGEAPEQGKGKAAAGGKPGADAKALQDKLNAAQEDAAAKDKALKEANSRIADLEKNIQDMKRLLEAQNKQMAALQKQPAAAPEAPKVAAVEPAKPAPEVKPEVAPAPAAQEAKPAEAPETKPVVKPKVEKKPAPKVAEPVAEPSFMDDLLANPLYLAGAGAVAVAGLVGALWAVGRRRKKSLASFEDSIMTGGDLKANTVFGNTGGGQIDTGDTSFLTDFSQGGMGAIDTNDVDPIAEAEVYMAYGRDAQAEEILKEAMSKDPSRHEVQLKLLEIYAGRRNKDAFETVATELYAATAGQGPVWERAAELGRNLDADNPLYTGGAAGAAAPQGAGPGAGAAGVAAAGVAAAAVVAAEAKAAPELDFHLDLDTAAGLPLDQATVPGETEGVPVLDLDTAAETLANTVEAPTEGALDLDLGTIIPQAVEKQEAAPADSGAIEFSLDLPELGELGGSKQAAAATAEADTLGGLDFDFDLETPAAAAAQPEPEALMPDLDLSGLDLEIGGEAGMGSALEEATTLAGAPGESWEEASTKLDLARAYVEMGDKEGAREILEEVMQEGGPEQQADAKKLLATLS
jgi:pilus assembly protein FimV